MNDTYALKTDAISRDILSVIGASLLIAWGAQLRIPVPFSPVPVTAQTLVVLLAGALLGSKRGVQAVVLYLLAGLLGWPIFAGASGGLAVLLGPTGGYLIGFIAAAYIVGRLTERGENRNALATIGALLLGTVVIYAFGLLRLAAFVGVERVIALGLAPFIIGDLFKLAGATLILHNVDDLFE
jgi:biotin transport system substrate-specific component